MVSEEDIQALKKELEAEQETLYKELTRIAVVDADVPGKWIAKAPSAEQFSPGDEAERSRQFRRNALITSSLSTRYGNVQRALKKIADGSYGVCEVSEQPISRERLFANPAARTCVDHFERA